MATSILMCRPDFYAIEYEINPWMRLDRPSDPARAQVQWEALYQLLTGLEGVTVNLVDPVPGSPDMVFTANAGLVHQGSLLLSHFRYQERRAEELHFERWFREHGWQVREPFGRTFFEGEGDALWFGRQIVLGYGFRTDRDAGALLAWATDETVVAVELVDPHFYHLDTCFMPLDGRSALWYPPGFSAEGQATLRELVPDLIEVPDDEAMRFACNAVVIDRTVVLNTGCPTVEAALRERGLTPLATELDEFHKAGGSAKCLVLRLSRP